MIFHSPIVGMKAGEIIDYDAHGNPVYGPDVETPFRGEMRPLQGDELSDGTRDFIRTRYRLFAPAGITLTGLDKIQFLGVDYQLVGEPEPHTINGRVHHLEALVERSTG